MFPESIETPFSFVNEGGRECEERIGLPAVQGETSSSPGAGRGSNEPRNPKAAQLLLPGENPPRKIAGSHSDIANRGGPEDFEE
jgi:hypothetical protein